MSFAKLIWNYLWIAPTFLQIVILWVMVRRGLHRQFPLFFVYTAFTIGEFLIVFPMYYMVNLVPGWLYGHTRLCFVAVRTALKFGIAYEIFVYVGRKYEGLNSSAKAVLICAFLILSAIAIVLAQHTPMSPTDDSVMFTATVLERSADFLQCGLMLGLLSVSRILHMQWEKPAFGIALGLAIIASADLILLAINAKIGYYRPLDYGYMGSYHVTVLVWLYYLAVPEKATKTSPDSLPDHKEFEAWSDAIKRLLQNG